MKSYRVMGGGGTHLHVEETGNKDAQAILFIHGYSQCRLSWSKQMKSELANDFRLVSMDIRGHGLSDKPKAAYGDSKLWADDIQAVIDTLKLKQPLLCGWSYGGVIICDYIRHHGGEQIGGVNFVAAISKLGESLFSFVSPRIREILPGSFSNDVEESMNAMQSFVRLLVHKELPPKDFYSILGYNVVVPPYVRSGLFARSLEHDDILAQIKKPLLITHGEDDAILSLEMANYHASRIKHAKVSYYPSVGHSPFWENPERFNSELRAFIESL